MLIDVSYFVSGPRHIQNASTSKTAGADSLAVNGHIEAYIKELLSVFLEAMLGEKEAGYAMDYLDMADDEENEGTEPSKYEIVCDKLKEPFADYVLFNILRDASSQATITGNVRLKCANEYVSPIKAQVIAWNRMVDANVKFILWAREGNCPIPLETQTNMLNRINQFNL
ncbi:hypothetical protein [uncultured Bacteroides sp.]|mgnify:CR=1 FL=1|uniref:hypothetical protein n=1 Tax=uncultured Bacteroides sp. TaxID=162156 RepID=UPI002598A917|nr:hypothetical protein [uncultured Bacteroides sp.]